MPAGRKLILITRSLYMRDFGTSGAFDDLGDDTWYITGPSEVREHLAGDPRYLGPVDMPQWRTDAYSTIRDLLLTHYRFRSRTARVKFAQRAWRHRVIAGARALPGVRQATIRRLMRKTGLHPELVEKMHELRPDIVIAPSSGIDGQVVDAFRVARALGIPSLGLMYNWDNLSSKAAFAVEPDYLGVVGVQSAEHATAIHRIPQDRVRVLGSPYIDPHFRHVPGSTASPFPFRYVLFAGCYQPFDERTALEQLDAAITANGLDLKIVYLPHPRRLRRKVDDVIDDTQLDNVLVEPHQRERYVAAGEKLRRNPRSRKMGMEPLPLDYYPALLENAEFVVCPLSTMMLEAAIFRRRVLVIAHHDGIHPTSPGVAINYLHFEGVDRVDTFDISRRPEDLVPLFLKNARDQSPPRRPPKEQMDHWVYHDERPFGERLAAFVDEILERHGATPALDGPALSAPPTPAGPGAPPRPRSTAAP